LIGFSGEAGFAGLNRAEHNDPEGVKPRRGVEVWRRPGRVGSRGQQRAANIEPDHGGVNRDVGRGVQKPNGLSDGLA